MLKKVTKMSENASKTWGKQPKNVKNAEEIDKNIGKVSKKDNQNVGKKKSFHLKF